MTAKSAMEIIKEQEKKIVFLENKLKSILGLIEILSSGNTEKAMSSLKNEKESSITLTLTKLIERFSAASSYLPKQDDKSDLFLKILIESMPFPVFIKDENSKYIYVNTLQANLFNLKESDIIGKHDNEFVTDQKEMEIISQSDDEVLLRNKNIELPNQRFSLKGKSYVFRTHKIPFTNPFTECANILGFSVDVTDTENLDKLKKILFIKSNPYV